MLTINEIVVMPSLQTKAYKFTWHRSAGLAPAFNPGLKEPVILCFRQLFLLCA
jgi:hypothetical protein